MLGLDPEINEGFYSPDGTWLIYRVGANVGGGDIYARSVTDGVADSVAVPLLTTSFGERSPTLSPNGRWLAYVSTQSGEGEEVYVRSFPEDTGPRTLVSIGGGSEPVWAHIGQELFYRNGANELVVVAVRADSLFVAGEQEMLFSMSDYLTSNGRPMYDLSPGDQRFVMLRIIEEAGATELIWFENWAEELKARMGN